MKKHLATIIKIAMAVVMIYFVANMIDFQDHVVARSTAEGDNKGLSLLINIEVKGKETIRFRVDKESWQNLDKSHKFPEHWATVQSVELSMADFDQLYQLQPGFLSLIRFADKSLLLLAFLLSIFCFFLSVYRWRVLLRAIELDISYKEVIRISWIGMFFNNILLSVIGGDVVKGYYIVKREHNRAVALTSLMVDRVLGLTGLALVAFFAVLPYLDEQKFLYCAYIIFALIAGALALMTLLFVDKLRDLVFHNRYFKMLPIYGIVSKIAEAGAMYKHRKGTLILCVCMSLVVHFTFIVFMFCVGSAIGVTEIDFVEYLVLVPVCQFITAIPVSPGGWGLGEFTYTYFFTQMGEFATYGAAVSVLMRINTIIFSLPGLVMWILSGKKSVGEMQHDSELESDEPIAERS